MRAAIGAGQALGLWAGVAGAEARFEDWPATEALGPGAGPVLPDFAGRDAWAREFRTAIRDGMAGGPNFAGRWSVIEIGCGTGCRFAYLVDHATGRVLPFPYGRGEKNQMEIEEEVGSRLLRVSWLESFELCRAQDMVWDGERFTVVDDRTYPPRDFACAP